MLVIDKSTGQGKTTANNKMKLGRPVYEMPCTSDFNNRCTLILETLNSFLVVFDMFNDKKKMHSICSEAKKGCNEIRDQFLFLGNRGRIMVIDLDILFDHHY